MWRVAVRLTAKIAIERSFRPSYADRTDATACLTSCDGRRQHSDTVTDGLLDLLSMRSSYDLAY